MGLCSKKAKLKQFVWPPWPGSLEAELFTVSHSISQHWINRQNVVSTQTQ
jgi:hypothetical protein